MQRLACPERDDWRLTAEQTGFDFHTIDGERYWDERAFYAFTLDEIERQIEAPTAEIDAMCLELVARAIDDEAYLRRLKIPEAFWPLISESWHRDEASLYGRLDLCFDGSGPAKLLEYNADTPTSIFEAAVFQWTWLEQAIERRIIPGDADQFNSIHERLIEAWNKLGAGRHAASDRHHRKRRGCRHAGLSRGHRAAGRACNHPDRHRGHRMARGRQLRRSRRPRRSNSRSSSIPGNGCFTMPSATRLAKAPTRWIEPPWKAILSNKGILPLLWEMFPNHPNLLPAFFEDDPNAASLGASFVRKPLYSREGANVALVSDGFDGRGAGGAVWRRGLHPPGAGAAAELFQSVSGDRQLADRPCTLRLSIREDENPITGNTSRFLPHAIL